jgi:protein-S-isoprenylcysteine O-methyltransferase Ste14
VYSVLLFGIHRRPVEGELVRGTVAAWLGVGFLTLGWYVKARLEEGFLREQPGAEEYASYARRTPMLVPFTRAFRS